jgi:hypothetical protein
MTMSIFPARGLYLLQPRVERRKARRKAVQAAATGIPDPRSASNAVATKRW